MSKFYQTKKFKSLQDEWYQKASQGVDSSGEPLFKDIEHDEETLTAYSTRFLKHPGYVWELKLAYYQLCESFLQHHGFDSPYEKIVWEYHSNGLGARAISKIFFKLKQRKNTDHTTISHIINRLEKIMKTTYLAPSDDETQDEH